MNKIFLNTLGASLLADLIICSSIGYEEDIAAFFTSSIIMNCTQYGLHQVIPKALPKFTEISDILAYCIEVYTLEHAGSFSIKSLSTPYSYYSIGSILNNFYIGLKAIFIPLPYSTYDIEKEIAMNNQLYSELLPY